MRSVIKLKTNLVKGFSDKAFDIAYCSTERVRRLKMVKNNSRHLYRFMGYSRSERARERERERERESCYKYRKIFGIIFQPVNIGRQANIWLAFYNQSNINRVSGII